MIRVLDLLVRSIRAHCYELSWSIEPTTDDPLDYTFQIFRSEVQEGSFEAITAPFSDKYYFIDNVVPGDHLWRKFYYYIRTVRKRDDKQVDSDVATTGTPTNLYAEAISGEERLVFQVAAGTKILVFPVKTFGQWCSCYDPISLQRTVANCLTCYNTNFVGGYHGAIETWAQIGQYEHKDATDQPAVLQTAAVSITLTNYPIVRPGDIIFQSDENLRWKVASSQSTKLGGALVHQNVVASLISRDDPAYKVELENFDIFRPNYPDMLMHPRTSL